MGFAASSGTIGKNGGIVSVQDTVKEAFCGGLVNIVLVGIVVEDSVEDERLIFDSFSLRANSGS
jgi:hypothetical protein